MSDAGVQFTTEHHSCQEIQRDHSSRNFVAGEVRSCQMWGGGGCRNSNELLQGSIQILAYITFLGGWGPDFLYCVIRVGGCVSGFVV